MPRPKDTRIFTTAVIRAPGPALRVALVLALGVAICLALMPGLAPRAAAASPASESQRARLHRAPVPELIGITEIEQAGENPAPTGRGIIVGHVEADPRRYLPNSENPRFQGVEFIDRTGEGRAAGHAQMTAARIYGPQGLAPGIDQVHCFASAHWLGEGHLRTGSNLPPRRDRPRLFTHSWVGSDTPHAKEVLRRVDLVIQRDDVVMCVGVNNGKTPIPHLLASSYNAIAVGSALNDSSHGTTRIDGEGRAKPDLVGPRGPTSSTTPMVTAVAARMLEAIDRLGDQVPPRHHSELVKALLMAGATKPHDWRTENGQILDQELGAGIVHLARSLDMLHAGRGTPHAPRPLGWTVRTKMPTDRAVYRFRIEQPVSEICISMTWHRRINATRGYNVVDDRPQWLATPRLANFDLELYRLDDDPTADHPRESIAASASDVDNVEHIYLRNTPAGEYHLKVIRRDDGHHEPWTYALAWRFE